MNRDKDIYDWDLIEPKYWILQIMRSHIVRSQEFKTMDEWKMNLKVRTETEILDQKTKEKDICEEKFRSESD